MRKISFFIGDLGRGGAERVISLLANHFSSLGWDVEICLLLENKIGYEINKDIRIVDMTVPGDKYIPKVKQWVCFIRRYLKNRNPDRVVSFIGRINALVLFASLGLNIKTIVSERNDPKHDGRGKITQLLCNVAYLTSSKIVFQTKYQMSCFLHAFYKKSCVIGNPVVVRETRKNVNRNKIVTVGRLLPQKNHELVIRAIPYVLKKYPDAELYIYGDGSQRKYLERIISDLSLSNKVFLCGNVHDVHSRICDANVFVMASRFEGLSNALIEAMMIGIPTISTQYPGIEEIIDDGENGFIIEQDNLEQMVEKIIYLMDNEKDNLRISENAIKTSRKYSHEHIMEQWVKVVESC